MDAIYRENIVDIDLKKGTIYRDFCPYTIGSGDNNANRFGIRVFRDHEAVDLSGASCQGFFRNSHDENIALTSYGTVDGNVAYITLPQACYNYDGQYCLSIKLIGGGVTGTMRIIDGMVDNTGVDNAIAPTGSVPTYQEILALYDEMETATEAAEASVNKSVRYDTTQSLTTAQKTQARSNIDAASEEHVDSLESQVNSLTQFDDISVGATVPGYITTYGAYSNDTSTLQIKKYPVKAGDYLRLRIAFPFASSGGVFQFQNNNIIPYDENDYIFLSKALQAS